MTLVSPHALPGRLVDGRLRGVMRRAFLEALFAHPLKDVPHAVLASAIWGDDPPTTWRHQLQNLMVRINAAVGAPLIRAVGPRNHRSGYRLSLKLLPSDIIEARPDHQIDKQTGLRRRRGWTEQEDAYLRKYVGRRTLTELADELTQRFGVARRTRYSVANEIQRLGMNYGMRGHTAKDVERMFGLSAGGAMRRWINNGYLRCRRRGDYVKVGPAATYITAEDIEAFIRAYPWEYDWRVLPPGRFRSVAETVNKRNPWLTTREAAALLRCKIGTVQKYLADGLLPNARRQVSKDGVVGKGWWRVQLSDVNDLIDRLKRAKRTAERFATTSPRRDLAA